MEKMTTLEPRSKEITAALNLQGSGIEYGPLNRIIVPKEIFPNVLYVDYADRNHLVEHYKHNPNVNVELIPEIDIVTGGVQIDNFVKEQELDFIVVSHVLEHVPDMIGWLEANLRLLKSGGRIGIAFPDRRYCFDLLRNKTMVSDLISAYLEKRTKPTFQQVCDHIYNVVKVTPKAAWDRIITAENAKPMKTPEVALKHLRKLLLRDDYINCHCWKFTDYELVSVLKEVRNIFSLSFDINKFSATRKYSSEFYLTIEKNEID